MRWNECLCAPDALSSTNEWGIAPRNLIFGETDYFNLSVSVQSLSVPSNTVSKGCVTYFTIFFVIDIAHIGLQYDVSHA